MAKTPPIELSRLAALLDDEDEGVAVSAIAELLNRESELGELPAQWQESSDPLLRRRAHQLQAALTLIRRRRAVAAMLQAPKVEFAEGLLQLHLQWFDNDSLPRIVEKYRNFLRELSGFPLHNLPEYAEACAALGIVALPESTLKPENYCLGTMLDDRSGSCAMWCGLLQQLMPVEQEVRVVRVCGSFALADRNGNLLFPQANWKMGNGLSIHEMEFFDARSLLRFALTNLFSAAVNSDSFRYILTIGQALTGSESDDSLAALPYPYNPRIPLDDEPENPDTKE